MLNKKILIIVLYIICNYLFLNTTFSAVLPITSWLNTCSYNIVWNDSSGSSYNWGWINTACNWSINFSTLWLPNGIFDLSFMSKDNTIVPWPNIMWPIALWTYKIDTTEIVCTLDEVVLNGIDNQYYDDWKLFYKSDGSASWKFDLKVTCKDTTTPWATCDWVSCVSWIKEIQFPSIMWESQLLDDYDPTEESISITKNYNWSWKQTDTINILENFWTTFALDWAWNITDTLDWTNTKVIFKDNSWNILNTITWITSLILTPDSDAPLVNNNIFSTALMLTNNWFTYESWNLGTLPFQNIFDGNIFKSKSIAALDIRTIKTPEFRDDWSWIKWYKISIENYILPSIKDEYDNLASNLNTRVTTIPSKDITHNFQDVSEKWDYDSINWKRLYDFDIFALSLTWASENENSICDIVWNCIDFTSPDFEIVANKPDLNNTVRNISNLADITNFKLPKKSDFSDTHEINIKFMDMYWNEVVPVSWIKNIFITSTFDNTLWLDQINAPLNWDWVNFEFRDSNWNINPNNLNNKIFTYTWTSINDLNEGIYKILLSSWVPTYDEYVTESWENIYWTALSAKLFLDSLNIKVNSLKSYNWIWENPVSLELVSVNIPDFRWEPIISFNYIDPIFPLVEWQIKSMTLKNEQKSGLTLYNLLVNVRTTNPFIEIVKSYITNWNEKFWNEQYNIVWNYDYTWGDWYWKNNALYGVWNNSYTFNILPQTLWWITDNDTKIWLFSVLDYRVWGKEIKLPWIQTWLKDFWVHTWTDFLNSNSYSNDSSIIFSEIDINWITQSNNNWTTQWFWATTTDSAWTIFNDFSKIKSFDLKTNINKNVSKLLWWYNKDDWIVAWGNITINDLSSDFTWVAWWLLLNGWKSIYYKDTDVKINCSGNCKISGNRTIIIENWNLTIDSNMYYEDKNAILWIILIWNESNWNVSQLRINENITNWVWIVYAEWPVVSVNSFWNIYDWSNIWENLFNQLHWKGSLATKNTIWWSIKSIQWECPYGTPHYENWCNQENSQAYDLIYLRRYARVDNSAYSWSTNPMWDWKIPLHSDSETIIISWNIEVTKDSINSWDSDLIKSTNYDAPLIVDYDSRLQSIIPLWFEK